jgi:hypothetical protein
VTNELTVQPQDPFSEMERMDEQQVLDEIKGRAIESLVYEIRQGGQIVTGLSLAGVSEVVRTMNANGKSRLGISDREPIVTETEGYFEVKAFAQDTQNGGGYWGIKRQPKTIQKRDGSNQADTFALEKAMAKAQRNALRRLIPEYFAKEMIAAFRQRGNAQVVENKTATQSKKTHAQIVEELTGYREQINSIDPTRLPAKPETVTDEVLNAHRAIIEELKSVNVSV